MAEVPLAATVGVPHPIGNLEERFLQPEIPVFIVSGRNRLENPRGVDPFGNERTQDLKPYLGIASVTVGEGLSAEELVERTRSETPKRKRPRVELKSVDTYEHGGDINPWMLDQQDQDFGDHPWVAAVREQLDRSQRRNITIYVHGYNTHLITNTEQAAEMYHRAGRDGAVINFEWPSMGQLLGYVHDKGNANVSTRHFRALLVNLARQTDAKGISILAHSAGTPIVANALREIRLLNDELSPERLQAKYRIDRVILAAPDMDLMEFLNAVMDGFDLVAEGVAVYASPEDLALKASSLLFRETRLGRSVGRLTPVESEVLRRAGGIEMIDVGYPESLHGDFLGHGYFLHNPWVSSDLGLFYFNLPPERRGLVREPGDIFWKFPEDYPERLSSLRDGIHAEH